MTAVQASAALRFAGRVAGMQGSVIDASTALLQRQRHDVVRFAMGSPAASAMPSAALAALAPTALGDGAQGAFDYAATEGDPRFADALLALLAANGVPAERDELLVTTGGMQGLDLACKLFLDPGDLVVVESPTYTNGTATIASYEGRMLEVPTDEDGMVVEALPELVAAAGGTPKLVYTIPNFQNPSGTTLSLARRHRLLELAARWGAIVLEDDPYGMLRFDGDALPGLRELSGRAANVVTVQTLSKILAPGLRLGWVLADPAVVAHMVDAKQAMDTCANLPLQRLVAPFVEARMDDHLAGLRETYRRSKLAMARALAETFADAGVTWTDPDGGFFLWLTLPDVVDAAELFPIALEEGVAYIPGAAFSVGGRFTNALRLCFATNAEERTAEGIRRLRRALDRCYGDGWRAR